MADFKQMLDQVKQMQGLLQERVTQINVEASAAGGLVSVRMNGMKQLTHIQLDPQLLQDNDQEMLQNLILAAVNEANRRVDDEIQQQVSGMTGGLNPFQFPGLF